MEAQHAAGDVAQARLPQRDSDTPDHPAPAQPIEVLAPEGSGQPSQATATGQHEPAPNEPATQDAAPHEEPGDAPAAVNKRKRRSRSVPVEVDIEAARALVPKLEAVLISCDRPVQATRIAQLLGLLPMEHAAEAAASADVAMRQAREEHACATVAASVRELNQQLGASGRAFRVELLGGGYRVMTLPEHADVVSKLHKARSQTKLSRAAVETLAVIAYRQPMTRAELESIRGVSCGEVLRTLVERRLVTVKGRAEELGRPLIYGTTPQFLEHFGLTSIKDLPTATEGLTS
jgi:segregation and condensation protein B